MRTKLEVIADVALLGSQDVLDLLRTLEQTISLDPNYRVWYVGFKYNNYAVARNVGHLYMSAHKHGNSDVVQAIDAALNKYYVEG
jgi:hypothetical protein